MFRFSRKLTDSIRCTAIFFVCLFVIHILHMRYFKVDVVLYASIFDGVLAALSSFFLIFVVPRVRRSLENFELALLLMLWLSFAYIYAISVPTIVDRSLSIYLLEKLQQRGGNIKQQAFPRVFTDEYLPEHRLVEVRLTEQLVSGTIDIRNGCVSLTTKGEAVVAFTTFFRANFLPPRRLLLGQYTDHLIDPMADSPSDVDYVCHSEVGSLGAQ